LLSPGDITSAGLVIGAGAAVHRVALAQSDQVIDNPEVVDDLSLAGPDPQGGKCLLLQ
jgi:hypothetical protein